MRFGLGIQRLVEDFLGLSNAVDRVHHPLFALGDLAVGGDGFLGKLRPQRIGLAQSFLHDPKILIYDEPVTGLDPLGLREMREIIQGLNQKGKTIFFSSHSIAEVEKLCHRVGILVQGRLVRVVEQKEWAAEPGRLEEVFVQTVSPDHAHVR